MKKLRRETPIFGDLGILGVKKNITVSCRFLRDIFQYPNCPHLLQTMAGPNVLGMFQEIAMGVMQPLAG